jgi:CheY-like chemotaxis protein
METRTGMIYPHSQIWTPETIGDIHSRAQGQYRLSGFRPLRNLPSFDDLVFLAAGLTRFPLEGYKEKCKTETTLGKRSATKPLTLETPVYVGISPTLARGVRVELARGSAQAHTSISVVGSIYPEERRVAHRIICEVPAQRGAVKLASSLKTDAIQLNVEDTTTTDILRRLITRVSKEQEEKIPVLVGLPAGRVENDVKAAVAAGADGIVLEGLKISTVKESEELLNYCRLPMMAAIPRAREALREIGALGEVNIVAATGIRNGADASKALALGADAVRIDESALIALGYSRSPGEDEEDNQARRVKPGDGMRVAKFINSMTMEIALLARSLGKGDVHSLEYEDLSALTLEASMMSGVRLAGE